MRQVAAFPRVVGFVATETNSQVETKFWSVS